MDLLFNDKRYNDAVTSYPKAGHSPIDSDVLKRTSLKQKTEHDMDNETKTK